MNIKHQCNARGLLPVINVYFIVVITFVLPACTSTNDTGKLNSLVSSTIEPPSVNCPAGGFQLESGIDDNTNGILDSSEIDSTEYLCNEPDGLQSLTKSTPVVASFVCPDGGQSIDYGIDDNANSVLDTEEVDGNSVVCSNICLTTPFEVSHNFNDMGTFTTSLLDLGNVVITGAAGDINVLNLNGLGVVGGSFDNSVDHGESLSFSFTRPALMVSYSVGVAGNQDGDGLLGEAFIEAFGIDKTSLGMVDVNGGGNKDVSQLFGNVPITSFTVTAYDDNHRTSSVTFTTCE